MYRGGRGDGRGRGGNMRGSMRGGGGGEGHFASWTPSAYDNRPTYSSMGSSLDWANSEARAKMLGIGDTAERGSDDYYGVYGRDTAPGPADYHSSYPPDYVTYPVPVRANQPIRPLLDNAKPRGGGSQVVRGGGLQSQVGRGGGSQSQVGRGGGSQVGRGGGSQVGKRPPAPGVQKSPSSEGGAKRVKLSSMNELLESSQRDMSAFNSQGNSELSKVLEKQQRLLEIQSKLISEMAGETNGASSNGATKPAALMEQESKSAPAAASGRGAHQRGGSASARGAPPRGGTAQRRGEGQRGRPAARRGGHQSIWETLGSAGRGVRGRGEAVGRGRGLGSLARDRGEGSLARGRGEGPFARGRGPLARGRGAAPYGRGSGLEYEGDYAERDPYAYGEHRGRGALRGARGRGGAPSKRGAWTSRSGEADPYAADPYAEDPYAADPYTEDPYAADPYAAEPYVEDPYARDPYAEDPYARDPYSEDPYARDPYSEDPYARDPYGEDPYARDPYGEDPHARDPYAADPYARDPYGEDPHARDPFAADPYARDPYGEDPYARDPYAADRHRPFARPMGRGRPGKPQPPQRRDPNLPLYDGSSVESRMHIFIGYIFQFRKIFLPISAIETTRHDHIEDVKVRTQYTTFEDERKTPSTFGILRINGIILAVQQSNEKDDLKDATYKKALYHLLTMSVSEMFDFSFKARVSVPKKFQEEQKLKAAPCKVIGNRLQYMIELMREELFENQRQGVDVPLKLEVDVACGNAQAGITLVYRQSKGNKMVTCELYADDLMLAKVSAFKKMTAYHYAYRDTKNYLMNYDKTSLDIVRENGRLQDVNVMADDVIDIQFKGKNHERGSNLWILKSKFPNTWRQDIADTRHLVVMMHSHDRASIPYKVLEDLANMNHMLIQYVNYSEADNCPFRCIIFLQKELVGDGDGYSRAEAKDNAARKVLASLTENNPVIQVGKRLYNKVDYNFAAVKEAAQKLQTENPDMFKDWKPALHPQPKGDDPPLDDLTPYVDKILEDLIQDYICTQGVEEIILDRDFPACFITMMLQTCKDLDVDIEKKDGDQHQDRTGRTVIQKSVFKNGYPSEIVKMLQESNNQSGRYSLTQWIDENGQLVKKRA